MAKEVIGASVNIEYKSVGEMRKAIKEATGEVIKLQNQFGETSKEALEAAKRVAQLKDRLKEAGETVDLFDPGNKFKVFGNAVTAAAGGFAALQGALGLFGVKSKEVEEQLLKVQSALALSQGLSTIADAGKDFARLGSIIKTQVVTAFSTLRGAIAATGIGALVIAVGALIANFDKLKAAILGTNPELDENLKKIQDLRAALEAENKIFNKKLELLKLQGVGERELTRLKIEETKKRLAAAQAELKAQQAVTQDLLNSFANQQGFLASLKGVPGVGGAVGDILSFFGIGNGEDVQESINKTKDLTNSIEELGLQIKILEEEAKKEPEKKTGSKLKGGVVERIFPDIVAISDPEAIDEIITNVFDNVGKLTTSLSELALNPELEKLRRNLLLTPEQQDLLNLQDYYNQQMELVKGNQALELALTEDFERRKTEITRFYNQQRLQVVSSILGQAAQLLGKQTAAGKALAIAEATINTYVGATNALRSKVPFPEPAATAIRIAQAALIVANGIKSIKEIVKTKVPGGDTGGSVPSISTTAPISPQISPQAQAQALNANAINNLGNTALRAYILNADLQNQAQINEYLKRGSSV